MTWWSIRLRLHRRRIRNLAHPGNTAPTKLLFICSRNKWRSRTAEELYRDFPGCVAKSAGPNRAHGNG